MFAYFEIFLSIELLLFLYTIFQFKIVNKGDQLAVVGRAINMYTRTEDTPFAGLYPFTIMTVFHYKNYKKLPLSIRPPSNPLFAFAIPIAVCFIPSAPPIFIHFRRTI